MEQLHTRLQDLVHPLGAFVYWLGDAAKQFIEDCPSWLTIAFVILLALGFWVAGKGARWAADEGA